MTALPKRQRRRTAMLVGIDLAAVVVAAVLLFVGVLAIRDYTAAKDTGSDLPVLSLPTTPTALFATVDTADRLTSVTVFVLAPGDELGGSIVSVPVNADTSFTLGTTRIPLQQVYAEGGQEALVANIESVLRLTIDFWKVADPFEAGQLFTPVSPLQVDLPADVRRTDDGETSVAFKAGVHSLSGPQAAEVLTAKDDSELERVRRPNIEAIWAALGSSVGEGLTGLSRSDTVASFDDVTATLFSGPVGSRGLSATEFSAVDNPEGLDVEQLDRDEVVLVFASIAPANTSAPGPGLVFRVEAPPGYDDKVQAVIGLLLYFGGNVSSVSLDGPLQPQTEMYVYNEKFVAETAAYYTLLGVVTFPEPTYRVEGADVTLVLGTGFLDSTTMPVPPSTTTIVDG